MAAVEYRPRVGRPGDQPDPGEVVVDPGGQRIDEPLDVAGGDPSRDYPVVAGIERTVLEPHLDAVLQLDEPFAGGDGVTRLVPAAHPR